MLLILATFPEEALAKEIVTTLVGEHLIACGNILPGVESIYFWEGKIQNSAEVLVLMKTTPEAYPVLERRLKALHPYEVPEIIAVKIDAGFEPYLKWIHESCPIGRSDS